MTVYLTHAEADQAIADDLAGKLHSTGFLKSETGVKGFFPLHKTDLVVALWSKNTQFSVHRLQIEKRILEAWSEDRLILVKLDHHFLPVGLRDLPVIDATFEAARSSNAWMKVQKAVREGFEKARRQLSSFSADADLLDTSGGSPAPPSSRNDKGDDGIIESLAEETDDPLVFISYSHSDSETVTKLVQMVQENGKTVWIDRSGITPGENWAGEIVRGIKSADGIMIMCSPRAFESDHIKREVYLADRYRKPMLPIFIEAAEPPEDFEFFFAGIQHLQLFNLNESDYPAAISQALQAI